MRYFRPLTHSVLRYKSPLRNGSCMHRMSSLTQTLKEHASDDLYIVSRPPSWSSERLLVLDSSFNPPTRAHAALISETLHVSPQFSGVLLLFSSRNADKQLSGASIQQRVEMMQLLAKSLPNCAVGITVHARFVDKARMLDGACFLMGVDTVERLLEPKYYDEPVEVALAPFFARCSLVCASRPGFTLENSLFSDQIKHITLDPEVASLSSTLARQHANTEVLDTIVSPAIADYIRRARLYQK